MRDYILSQSIARDSAFVFPKLRRMISSWFVKRNLAAIEKLDDYMLNDIGLTRDDLRSLRGLPLDVDMLDEMMRLRDRRSLKGVRRR
jgi:uncharacterized protein YjiS (DUF1127 family)